MGHLSIVLKTIFPVIQPRHAGLKPPPRERSSIISATRANAKREDCKLYLFGIETDLAPFEARFAAAVPLAQPVMGGSRAHRLMEIAQ